MENTNPKKLRAELKDYLDLATDKPIRINRRSGESFILMNENHYSELQKEINSLQGQLIGLNDVLNGRVSEWDPNEDRIQRFRDRKNASKNKSK